MPRPLYCISLLSLPYLCNTCGRKNLKNKIRKRYDWQQQHGPYASFEIAKPPTSWLALACRIIAASSISLLKQQYHSVYLYQLSNYRTDLCLFENQINLVLPFIRPPSHFKTIITFPMNFKSLYVVVTIKI